MLQEKFCNPVMVLVRRWDEIFKPPWEAPHWLPTPLGACGCFDKEELSVLPWCLFWILRGTKEKSNLAPENQVEEGFPVILHPLLFGQAETLPAIESILMSNADVFHHQICVRCNGYYLAFNASSDMTLSYSSSCYGDCQAKNNSIATT